MIACSIAVVPALWRSTRWLASAIVTVGSVAEGRFCDVTVEIKVSKRGYEDQVKRFNVRQALDQQEISGFFELVEKEVLPEE